MPLMVIGFSVTVDLRLYMTIIRANFVDIMIRIFWHILLLLLLCSTATQSSTIFTGKVINVADGNTITVLTEGNQSIKVRLARIDCPEGGQAFGDKTKQFLAAKVAGKRVRIAPETTDRYGRTVGMVPSTASTSMNRSSPTGMAGCTDSIAPPLIAMAGLRKRLQRERPS
jgi:endonuclease YncB( thermonuclease family)